MLEYQGKYGKAKIMIDFTDQETVKQIYEFLNHEAFTNPIAIMPDTHAGKGAVIGFTMEMTDKIIPNVVGVDINCFVGETKVPLLNGQQYMLKELFNMGEFYVYSMNENLQIVPGKAKCIKTKENVEIIQIGISGGEIVECTPDHLFMLIDGTYKKAQDLIPLKDSLMPLYRTYDTRDGYESIHSNKSKAIHTHVMVSKYFYGEKPENYFTHHKNNKLFDNTPQNLTYVDKRVHSSEHRKETLLFKTKEFKEKKIKTIEERGYYFREEFREKKIKVGTKNITTYQIEKRDEWLEKIKDNGKRGKKYLCKLQQEYTCDVCGKKCGNYGSFKRHKKIHKDNNHKVLFINKLDKKENVYCLQVEKYHNFAISAGVFVHNCGMLLSWFNKNLLEKISREEIFNIIRKVVPLGTSVHNECKFNFKSKLFWSGLTSKHLNFVRQYNSKYGTDYKLCEYGNEWFEKKCSEIGMDYGRAICSCGTLGSGNHFIELGKSEKTENYSLTVHCGSRQLGLKVAEFWQKKAGKSPLSFLTGDDMFSYLTDMLFAAHFAEYNRKTIVDLIKINSPHEILTPESQIETVHNFIDHKDFIIRKGAIRSYMGEQIIIPLNMEDGILICEGKSNPEWNFSAPHGAGRIGSRRWAKDNLNLQEAEDRMKKKDIYFLNLPVDELKGAYKDPQIIIDSIGPTATIIDKVKPIMVIKDV